MSITRNLSVLLSRSVQACLTSAHPCLVVKPQLFRFVAVSGVCDVAVTDGGVFSDRFLSLLTPSVNCRNSLTPNSLSLSIKQERLLWLIDMMEVG